MCDVESCGFITSGKSGGVDRSVMSRLSNVPSISTPHSSTHNLKVVFQDFPGPFNQVVIKQVRFSYTFSKCRKGVWWSADC